MSPEDRHLVDARGEPFLYLADTAWQLFHRLTREEAQRYLEDRAAKGFTVVQAVVLGLDGLEVPNAYGERAFVDRDPRRPNEAYFAHVDAVVDRAGALGLTVGMLPTLHPAVLRPWLRLGARSRRRLSRLPPARRK